MMTREQLLHLFSRFSFLTSLPEVKQRITDAVRDKQDAVAVTTEIQEEILREMGIGMPITFYVNMLLLYGYLMFLVVTFLM